MAAPSCIDNEVKSLAHLVFGLFGGENVTFLQDYDVITWGFPLKTGIPQISCTILCRNVSYDTLI